MRRLPLVLIIFLGTFIGYQFTFYSSDKSPHGSNFDISCKVCHSAKGWSLDKEIYSFDHNKTDLPLIGSHIDLNCRACHPTLIFDEAGNECSDCHTDLHSNTLGQDCSRCHTPFSWLVSDITEMHLMSRFPLAGPHLLADCNDCHFSDNFLKFEPIGVECFDCHKDIYIATSAPNHTLAGYSQDCSECHNVYSFEWGASGFSHTFFPLTLGHEIHDCAECHQTADYASTSSECFSCHEANYNETTQPNHIQVEIDNDCALCHSTIPGWVPADFPNHNDYFVLNGAHSDIVSSCSKCHNPEFTNTPVTCFGCHETDFNETTNPNHVEAEFSNECESCHSEIAWEPATFDHDELYILTGAHLSTSCADCHLTGYENTPNTCFGCHENDYNSTNDPPHLASQFDTQCDACHTTNAWEPATFDHDGEYFPIYDGEHDGEWNTCADCHTTPGNYAMFSCIDCHEHNQSEMNDEHDDVGDYSYNTAACFDCHPDGVAEDKKHR